MLLKYCLPTDAESKAGVVGEPPNKPLVPLGVMLSLLLLRTFVLEVFSASDGRAIGGGRAEFRLLCLGCLSGMFCCSWEEEEGFALLLEAIAAAAERPLMEERTSRF